MPGPPCVISGWGCQSYPQRGTHPWRPKADARRRYVRAGAHRAEVPKHRRRSKRQPTNLEASPFGPGTDVSRMTPAKWEESSMTTQPSVRLRGQNVALELSDASGATVSTEMDRHQALAMMMAIAQAVNALPADQTTPLHLQKAFLKGQSIPPSRLALHPTGMWYWRSCRHRFRR
jgi:hypothetical protein